MRTPRPTRAPSGTILAAPVRHAGRALDLIEQIGELAARPLVGGGVDVRDVVRDHIDVQLLGIHARRGDGQGSHDAIP